MFQLQSFSHWVVIHYSIIYVFWYCTVLFSYVAIQSYPVYGGIHLFVLYVVYKIASLSSNIGHHSHTVNHCYLYLYLILIFYHPHTHFWYENFFVVSQITPSIVLHRLNLIHLFSVVESTYHRDWSIFIVVYVLE